jgi:hypothetical protein
MEFWIARRSSVWGFLCGELDLNSCFLSIVLYLSIACVDYVQAGVHVAGSADVCLLRMSRGGRELNEVAGCGLRQVRALCSDCVS